MTALESILVNAHKTAAWRDNVSTSTLRTAYRVNGHDYIKSITAAMMMLGGMHAPVKQAYLLIHKIIRLLRSGSDEDTINVHIESLLTGYDIIPGFGSHFFKGEADPILNEISEAIKDTCHPLYFHVGDIIYKHLLNRGKLLYPNLAFYTAAVALVENRSMTLCEQYLIEARIVEWRKILERMEDEE